MLLATAAVAAREATRVAALAVREAARAAALVAAMTVGVSAEMAAVVAAKAVAATAVMVLEIAAGQKQRQTRGPRGAGSGRQGSDVREKMGAGRWLAVHRWRRERAG